LLIDLTISQEDAEWYDEHYWRILKKLRNSLRQWRDTQPEVIPLMYRMLDPLPDGRPEASQLVATLSAKHFCEDCCQEHQKRASKSGKQPEHLMSRLSIHPNPGVIAGPSALLVRRSSAPAVSMSQGPTRTYAPRGRTGVVEEDNSDDEDEDEDDEDSDETE
jgi:hypothetical protein